MLSSPRRPALRRTAGYARRRRLRPLASLAAALALPVTAAAFAAVPGIPSAHPAAAAAQSATAHRTAAGATAAAAGATAVPAIAGAPELRLQEPSPLSVAQCLAKIKIRCYTPLQYRVAYNLNPLYSANITGKGRTIVIVDSFGSPTIRTDLAAFDRQWGFPNSELDILKYGRNFPKFNANNATMDGWAEETTLDVEYAHAVAPGARIVLVETPVAETEGVTGLPQMMAAEKILIDNNIGDVISQSFGATENTFPGFAKGNYSTLLSLRYAFADAARHRVTVLAAAGDSGATDDEADGVTLYPYRVDSWPSSDPLVTSVGGTQLVLAQDGNKIQPDGVWNDGYGAGGGGVSKIFGRPTFQNGVANVVGNRRGTPDISMSAAVNGGCWIYESFEPSGPGWEIFGGTSEATPMFAGIVALADQVAGHRLGNINAALYTLGALSRIRNDPFRTGIVDVTSGNNSFGSVTGYTAGAGYDLASGWGTIDAATFVRALAKISGRS
ncbi:MAG TPA: S53 family peptidase [Streptosporangiaceae bacterium]|nr:S53 family peptidase [Streptosporangiaceae bacterium]